MPLGLASPRPRSAPSPSLRPRLAAVGEQSALSVNMEEDAFLEEKAFQHYCAEFLKHSQQIGDGWEWKASKDSSDGYLCKTHFQAKATARSLPGASTEEGETWFPMERGWPGLWDHRLTFHCSCPPRGSEEALEVPSDDSEVPMTAAATEVVRYEYHVLYSCSHQVPVLYFRASFADGRPLALQDIWDGVHECYQARLRQGPWDTITQQEHPVLGQPFFVLHPCKTTEFMTPVLKNSQKINRRESKSREALSHTVKRWT
ncbi:ubiquitin-like-conjugating enzyme ATG10 isoform X2 [Octodon degus]|uniref:Ubiquitin-like-conjugating enzyme ATG10 n=1 Tax=Octodon degus TaxID=10160 RepID=A0A6P6DAS8_OCTDE|nr:ubiquitin-like-conjugating enzyme ATG10 isoform X2 [Octodon degus]